MIFWAAFWAWYERTYLLNVSMALGLFLLQVTHLVWLFGEVVWSQLFGWPLFTLGGIHELFIVLVDYTEIPALISVSLMYVNDIRRQADLKSFLYLSFLNLQWLHLFWISDEFVVTTFNAAGTVLPLWLAWLAVTIDYLEVPVMVDTVRRFIRVLTRQ